MSTPYSSANSPYAYSPIPISTALPSLTPNNLNNQQNRYNNNNNSSNSPKPIPIPLLQRTRHPSIAGGGSLKHSNVTGGLGGAAIEDSILETKKVCALLLGVGTGEGLLAESERGLINAIKRRDNAFEETEEGDESTKGPPIEVLMNNLHSLLQTLRTSPLGGLTIQSSVEQIGEQPSLPVLIEKKSIEVQKLFKERQRAKEGAEIAGSVLGSN